MEKTAFNPKTPTEEIIKEREDEKTKRIEKNTALKNELISNRELFENIILHACAFTRSGHMLPEIRDGRFYFSNPRKLHHRDIFTGIEYDTPTMLVFDMYPVLPVPAHKIRTEAEKIYGTFLNKQLPVENAVRLIIEANICRNDSKNENYVRSIHIFVKNDKDEPAFAIFENMHGNTEMNYHDYYLSENSYSTDNCKTIYASEMLNLSSRTNTSPDDLSFPTELISSFLKELPGFVENLNEIF